MNVSESKNQYLHEALDLMELLGGSFVKSLAATCRVADDENFRKLVGAFPEIFDRYAEMAVIAVNRRTGDGTPVHTPIAV